MDYLHILSMLGGIAVGIGYMAFQLRRGGDQARGSAIETASNEIQILQAANVRLQQELNSCRTELTAATAEIVRLRADIEALRKLVILETVPKALWDVLHKLHESAVHDMQVSLHDSTAEILAEIRKRELSN